MFMTHDNPHATTEHAEATDDGLFQPDGTTDDAEDRWHEIVSQIRQQDPESEPYRNLQVFLEHLGLREEGQQELGRVYEQGLLDLRDKIDCFADEIVGSVYQESHAMLKGWNAVILELMSKNHERRQAFAKALDDAKKVSDDKLHQLMATLLQLPIGALDEEKGAIDVRDAEESAAAATMMKLAEKDGTDEQRDPDDVADDGISSPFDDRFDPNWNEIAFLHESSRENIAVYLDARAKLQEADADMQAAILETKHAFKEAMEHFKTTSREAFETSNEPTEVLRADIQDLISSNFERRSQFATYIEEHAQMTQGIFARLMATAMGPFSLGKNKNGKHDSISSSNKHSTNKKRKN
jgi:hypothetical protein